MLTKLVLASQNSGKIAELKTLLQPLKVEVIPQEALGVKEVEETGLSFVENALIKARHAATATGLPALADDSGLVVPSLSGAPGIYSARYAGPNVSFAANIAKLLDELKPYSTKERHAYFYCVLVLMRNPTDPIPLICQGKWEGQIAYEVIGDQGFGYDPVFYLPNLKKTAAQLSSDEKNNMSHRHKALQSLLGQLMDQPDESIVS